MDLSSRFISVMGTVGSGKTTASKLLADHFGWQLIEENFGDNAFLPRFYEDPSRWAFHSQTFFLTEKVAQSLSIEGMLTLGGVVQDTPIYQDVFGYARTQHVLGQMDENEWKLYQKIFTSFEAYLPKPDVIIYLETSLPVVQKRIKNRGRSFEEDIPLSYLSELKAQNEAWLDQTTIPIVRINTDSLNIVTSESARKKFVRYTMDSL